MLDGRYGRVLSVLRGEGYSDEFRTISEFKGYSKESNLQEEELHGKWVLCEQQLEGTINQVQDRIIALFKYLIHTHNIRFHCLVQFWAAVEVEGRQAQYRLSTKQQPFCVSYLNKGSCRYRNRCSDYTYNGAAADDEDDDDDGEHHGGVRRAYLKKHLESTPDLRLYSTEEFPMRDYAARCGFRGYLALPLFDLLTNRCYGVLELLSCFNIMETFLLSSLDQGLQIAKMRSTHTSLSPIGRYTTNMIQLKHQQSEITEILELAIKAIPGLYLAQVWVPCKQCPNKSSNLCCMERAYYINSGSKTVNLCDENDKDMFAYLQACEVHNLQIDLSRIHQNSCDLSISQNPLAHYKAMARLSLCHTVSLKNLGSKSESYVIEFFVQPNCRQDVCDDSSLQLLVRIMEAKLKNFEFEWVGQLPKQLRQPDAIERESINMLKVMNFYGEAFPEANFTKYLGNVEQHGRHKNGWFFCSTNREESKSLLAGTPVMHKIESFLKNIAVKFMTNWYRMAQFWAPTKVEGRCYLETSYQPCVLGFLATGLASFRKECMEHHYCVDQNAKEEELGPPGRVFKNGLPEITPDISFYSVKDFFLRTYALHCGFQEYFVLPVFDEDNQDCVGVLEFIGFDYFVLYSIKEELEEVKLSSTLIDKVPRFLADEQDNDITHNRKEALVELRNAFNLIRMIPQLYKANVWVPYEECAGTNTDVMSCMELALSSESTSQSMPTDQVRWVHVQPKKGIIGRVLASESQSCFCRNLRGFSIADQPLSHYEMSERCDVCFAITLRSSLTQDLVYVLVFFLYQGPATYEYLKTFLSFLLPIMKQTLKTFKMATGEQLGAEFVVEVIEFSEATKLISSEPVRFKSVPYGQKEDQDTEEQQVESVSYAKEAQGCSEALNSSLLQNDSLKNNSAATRSLKKTRGKRTNSELCFEIIKKHFGMRLKDVEQETSFSISKIKRICRKNGIDRWPPSKPYHTESSLVRERESGWDPQQSLKSSLVRERESGWDPQQSLQPSSSSNHLLLEESPQHVLFQEAVEKVTIKVRYKDTIRFEFCLSMGVGKLFEEVAIKLNLERGTFKLKYIDEDEEEMLLAGDDDLQSCPKSKTATGKTCIHFFVQLISE